MGTQTVGYAYFLDFVYIYCENIDNLYNVLRDGTVEWTGTTGVPSPINFATGKQSTVYGSGYSNSNVVVYDGSQNSITEMVTWTGLSIGYKNSCAFVFDQAFIGDNVQTIPKYTIIANNETFEHISNFHMIDGNANPIDIIYNILRVDLNMPPDTIDAISFQAAAEVVFNEGLGVGLVMGSTRKIMSWIEDQLAIVDGVIFVDNVTNRISIKLLRDDYDVATIVQLDDSNTSKVTIEGSSWANTYNKFVLKYTYLANGKTTAVEFINTAARNALGYDRIKTIEFPSINSGAVLSLVANRIVAKLGTPLAGIKASVDYIDYPNIQIGDVIKFTSDRLQIADKVFRVLKITGDNEEKSTINVEGIEDIFSKSYTIDVPDADAGSAYVPPDYSLLVPKRTMVKDAQREMLIGDGIVWLATPGANDEFILSANCQEQGGLLNSTVPGSYCTLATVIPADITGLNSSVVSSKEYNRDYEFIVNDVDGNLFEYFGTATTLQTLKHVAYIGNEEFCFKSMEDLLDGTFKVTGVVRGLNDTSIVEHAIGTSMFISALDGRLTSTLVLTNTAPTLHLYTHNHVNVSPVVVVSPSYGFTTAKPYNPVPYQTVWGATNTISWRPRVALAGANYRSADNISGGEDEGVVTGYYEVTAPGGAITTVNPVEGDTMITHDTNLTGIHYVRHYDSVSNKFDTSIAITVT